MGNKIVSFLQYIRIVQIKLFIPLLLSYFYDTNQKVKQKKEKTKGGGEKGALSAFFLVITFITFFSQQSLAQVDGTKQPELFPVKVQLKWLHQYQFAGFYAAIQQGYYQQAGLAVELLPYDGSFDIKEKLLSKDVDFIIDYSMSIADFIHGAPIQLVMNVFQHSPMVFLSHHPIKNLTEIGGKKVSYSTALQNLAMIRQAELLSGKPIEPASHLTNLDAFINKEVDFYSAFITNEPYLLQQLNIPYYIVDPKQYGIQTPEEFVLTHQDFAQQHPYVVEAFRQATIQGWKYALANPESVIDYMLDNYAVKKSRQALLDEAYTITPYLTIGDRPIGSTEPSRLMQAAEMLADLNLITMDEFERFNPKAFLGSYQRGVDLTIEEINYLRRHPVIYIGNDPKRAPYSFLNETEQFDGLIADYFKLFEEKLGIKFQHQTQNNWHDLYEKTKQGEFKVLPAVVSTISRQQHFKFTKPYLSFPLVLVAKEDANYVESFDQIEQKNKIAVIKTYWSENYFKTHYPNIDLLLVDSIEEALHAVAEGKAFAFADNIHVINYYIKQLAIPSLRIVGRSSTMFDLAIGVNTQEPVLFSILQKALSSVTETEKQAIASRWAHLEAVTQVGYQQLWKYAGLSFLFLLVFLTLVFFFKNQRDKARNFLDTLNEYNLASKVRWHTEKVVWVSNSYAQLRQEEPKTITGENYFNLLRTEFGKAKTIEIKETLLAKGTWQGEVRLHSKGGKRYWVYTTLSLRYKRNKEPDYVWVTRTDITDRKLIQQLVRIDELTQLYNRRYFNQLIEEKYQQYVSHPKHALCLASFDIDYFKNLNDTYGHPAGDWVLQQVANELKTVGLDTNRSWAFRLGGEEFMLMAFCEQPTNFVKEIQHIIDRIYALKIENKQSPHQYVSVSAGVLCTPIERIGLFETLYNRVDRLLYAAKDAGRNNMKVG